ncbi:MAG TPA: PQQ-dependent sugar dehydrogenase [Albidovulum sp.]|uniref:PQQ-dependent sugar dehydrogenase n=1 Tax=Albidovulum sp. TaxID=1872424 RepID=UPI002BB4F92B|nr:PQQ-dependent sugar dehydrogenase [Albidovulum sp.]
MRTALVPAVLSLAVSPALAADWDYGERNTPGLAAAFPDQTRAPQLEGGPALSVEVLAEGLEHPWGIAVLPEGGYLVTERPGRLRHVGADGGISAPLAGVPVVLADGQGGLLDVALAADFTETGHIWLTYAKPVGGGLSATAAAVARFDAAAGALSDLREVFVQEPASPSPMHFGSRVVPAGNHVYVTTGEHFTEKERQFAQDPAKTYGKVVRLMADGSVPADNPFAGQGGAAGQVWSLGHRNLQGAALAPDGGLWTLEHGPQGGDELNRIEPGANYGWPVVSYGENYNGSAVGTGIAHRDGMEEPVYFWDPVIAPGGFVFYDGAMFPDWQGDVIAASLSPGGLVRLALEGGRVTGEARYLVGSARFRDVAIDHDGAILAVTDEEDGQLLRITPE